jgi:hypothetical protein
MNSAVSSDLLLVCNVLLVGCWGMLFPIVVLVALLRAPSDVMIRVKRMDNNTVNVVECFISFASLKRSGGPLGGTAYDFDC